MPLVPGLCAAQILGRQQTAQTRVRDVLRLCFGVILHLWGYLIPFCSCSGWLGVVCNELSLARLAWGGRDWVWEGRSARSGLKKGDFGIREVGFGIRKLGWDQEGWDQGGWVGIRWVGFGIRWAGFGIREVGFGSRKGGFGLRKVELGSGRLGWDQGG